MALTIDTVSINAERERSASDDVRASSPSEAEMEDLALSPMVDASSSDSLMPLSMTDSVSGSRPLPSLHGPITYRDVRYIGAFVAHVLLTLIATNAVRSDDNDDDLDDTAATGTSSPQLSASDIGVALRSLCVINLLFCIGWLLLFLFVAKTRFLQGSCAFSTVGLLALAALLLSIDALVLGVIVTVVAVVDGVWMRKTQRGFDFVAVLFELVVECLARHPTLAAVTLAILVVYTVWTSWLCTTLAFVGGSGSATASVSPWSLSMGMLYLHFFWTSNVLKNVLTVVVSGTTMLWYYRDDSSDVASSALETETETESTTSDPDALEQQPPRFDSEDTTTTGGLFGAVNSTALERRVVLHFLKAALTRSFGSICIGSLLCPAAHVVWTAVRWLRRMDSTSSILSRSQFIRTLRTSDAVDLFVKTYHKFAFVHIAGYSKPFDVAALDAWALIEARGVEAIVDDDPTSRLLLLGANGWASIMAALCVAALARSGHAVFFGLVSFCLCYTTLAIATNVVSAVIKTLFVCFAEHPGRLSQLNPLIYHRFVRLSELQSFRDHKPMTAAT